MPSFNGFFQDNELQNKPKSKATEEDVAASHTLFQILKKQGRLTRAPNLDAWANNIHRLHQRVSKERIQQLLKWMKSTDLKAEHVPAVLSSQSFCQKFERLETCMKRNPKTIAVNRLTKRQRILYERVTESYCWPSHIEPMLPALIQQSWINFTDFYQRFNQLESHYAKQINRRGSDWQDVRFAKFLQYAGGLLEQCPLAYLTGWYDEMHSVKRHSKSTLRPHYLIWDAHDLLFERQVWIALESWGSFATAWNRVKRELEV